MKLKTKYKDFKIEFNTNDGNFIAYDKNNNIIKKTKAEEEIIQYLDNYENNKNRLNIPIIRGINPFDFSIKTGKIVSIINKSNDKVEEVYVSVNGEKFREYTSLIYEDTQENRKKINKIIEIRRKIELLKYEEDVITDTLTHPNLLINFV